MVYEPVDAMYWLTYAYPMQALLMQTTDSKSLSSHSYHQQAKDSSNENSTTRKVKLNFVRLNQVVYFVIRVAVSTSIYNSDYYNVSKRVRILTGMV